MLTQHPLCARFFLIFWLNDKQKEFYHGIWCVKITINAVNTNNKSLKSFRRLRFFSVYTIPVINVPYKQPL